MNTNEDTQPKLLDVARHAGVSPATVSRVINRTAPVKEETRARVLASITALGYEVELETAGDQPMHGLIALLITDITNPFFPEIVSGVEEEARIGQQGLLLCNTSEDSHQERQALQLLPGRPIDGIIVCASRVPAQDLIALHEQHEIPMVVINRRLDHRGIPCITIDFANAAYRATQHLLSLGHTRIAFLSGYSVSESSMARRRGIEQALSERGLELEPDLCLNSFPGIEGGFQAMSSLLTMPIGIRPTAIVAYNDVLAIGAMHAVRTHGLSVPNDISVVGFDGITMAAHTDPPLTTVEQPKYQMGKLAMQMLNRMIHGDFIPTSGYTLLESTLVIRQSTAIPARTTR